MKHGSKTMSVTDHSFCYTFSYKEDERLSKEYTRLHSVKRQMDIAK